MSKAFWDWDEMEGIPGYTDAHRAFRAKLRAFVDKDILPYVDEWERAGGFPDDLHELAS